MSPKKPTPQLPEAFKSPDEPEEIIELSEVDLEPETTDPAILLQEILTEIEEIGLSNNRAEKDEYGQLMAMLKEKLRHVRTTRAIIEKQLSSSIEKAASGDQLPAQQEISANKFNSRNKNEQWLLKNIHEIVSKHFSDYEVQASHEIEHPLKPRPTKDTAIFTLVHKETGDIHFGTINLHADEFDISAAIQNALKPRH